MTNLCASQKEGDMPAIVKLSDLNLSAPVQIPFGFTGVEEKYARAIVRDRIRSQWPEQKRPTQSVYCICLTGTVAVAYPNTFSPVIYIGEGDAYARLSRHVDWLVPLLMSVPQLGVEIRLLESVRRNNRSLYRHIEADLIDWFSSDYGALPWFNRQQESGKKGAYEYKRDARKLLNTMIGVGAGRRYLWAIQPTKNNATFDAYSKGTSA